MVDEVIQRCYLSHNDPKLNLTQPNNIELVSETICLVATFKSLGGKNLM